MVNRAERAEQRTLRGHKLTWTLARRVLTGKPEVWADVAEVLLSEEGQTYHDPTPGTPEQLARGIEMEPRAAVEFWERHPEYDMEKPRIIYYPNKTPARFSRWLAVSPDRLLRRGAKQEALVEIKCPMKHEVFYALLNGPANEHWRQMQYQMLVSRLKRCFYVVYHPEWGYKQHVVERDEIEQKRQHRIITRFLAYLERGAKEPDYRSTIADF